MKTQTFGIEIKMNHINRERAAVEAGQRRQHFRTAHTRYRVRQPAFPTAVANLPMPPVIVDSPLVSLETARKAGPMAAAKAAV